MYWIITQTILVIIHSFFNYIIIDRILYIILVIYLSTKNTIRIIWVIKKKEKKRRICFVYRSIHTQYSALPDINWYCQTFTLIAVSNHTLMCVHTDDNLGHIINNNRHWQHSDSSHIVGNYMLMCVHIDGNHADTAMFHTSHTHT